MIKGKINDDLYDRLKVMGIKLPHGTLNKNDGRVRVFCRAFPGTSKSGYALRSRIVWWVYTGESLSGFEYNIHHKNGDRTDDRIENLEKLEHVAHSREHNGYRWQNVVFINRICEQCNIEFKFEAAKLKDKSSGTKQRGRFCSATCYHKFPKDPAIYINRKRKAA